MDSVLHGEREQLQTGRRMSQDINALHYTLAARSSRSKLFSRGTHKTRPVAPNVPNIIVEEGGPQAKPIERNVGYHGFVSKLRENLANMKDGHGKPLYTAQQIESQLDDPQVCAIDHYDKSFGETGGVTCFGRGETGMVHSHAEVPVSSLIMNNDGFREMDQKWASVADSAEATFRWIHLPANNMEWVRHAISQILSHYMAPEDEDDPASTMVSTSALENQILRTELWEGQQNVGAPELPHARFMRPFCHKIDASIILPESKIGRTLSRHDSIWSSPSLRNPLQEALGSSMVLYMPFLHWVCLFLPTDRYSGGVILSHILQIHNPGHKLTPKF
jgi:hypothetical protein